MDMKIDSKKVKLIYGEQFEPFSYGYLQSSKQSVIGLPKFCMYSTTAELKESSLNFDEKPIDWDSRRGQALSESLRLSDKHVKFTIARELMHIKDMHFIPLTLHVTGFCLLVVISVGTVTWKRQGPLIILIAFA